MDERLKLILGAAILIISYYIGELLSYAINGFISPAVMGMLVLFTLLKTGLVKEIWIESFAVFLLDNLMLFFIPATAGVALISFSSIKEDALAIVLSVLLTSLLVLWLVGYIVQKFERTNGE